MTALPTLDPEIADLGLALGLLTAGSGDSVELDSDWFSAPGDALTGVLADDGRRSALVRFAEAVLASGTHTERSGVTMLPLFDLRKLSGDTTLPDLTIQASIDARPTDYVEVGVAMSLATTGPVTATTATIPLYRSAKAGRSVAEPFALLAGSPVAVSTAITVDARPVATDAFGLGGVAVSVACAVVGDVAPTFSLSLTGLHLPGAAESTDLQVGGDGQPIEETLLSLILGLVKQAASGLSGAAGTEVSAALDLVGLGAAPGIPSLPVDEVLAHGASALRDWFASLMGSDTARAAWLGAVSTLLGGAMTGGQAAISLGTSGVSALIGVATSTGPGGHLQVTPQLGLSIHADVAGAVRVGAELQADLFTVDTATGSLSPVPQVDVVVTATGSGTGDAANLLSNATLDIGGLRLGLSLVDGTPRALIQATGVVIGGQPPRVIDLSTPDAALAAAGELASDVIGAALDALGPAGADLKGLLGLSPPSGVPALDVDHLLTDPLGTVRDWWHTLVSAHQDAVPAVLTHLFNLVAAPLQAAQPSSAVTGTGTAADPWSVAIASKLSLDAWVEGDLLVLAPTVSLRTGTLAGGCTTVLTTVRVELASFDLVAGHATFLSGAELTTQLRDTAGTRATLSLGTVALTADFVGIQAGWRPTGGFGVQFLAPSAAVIQGDVTVPLVFPTVDEHGHVNVPAASWQSVESLVAVLGADIGSSWVSDLLALTGWTVQGGQALLSLADLVADPATALRAWAGALVTDAPLVASVSASLAHLFGGSSSGLAGLFSGSGRPDDPWLVGLGPVPGVPSLALWQGPYGPVAAASSAAGALQTWRPGNPGIASPGLVAALQDEAGMDPEVAILAVGRDGVAAGLDALVGRWAGTDGLVAPPSPAVDGLTTVLHPDLTFAGLPLLDLQTLVPGGLPAGAVVVRVAVSPVADLPWTPAAGRLLDLTAPGLAPASFTVGTPATGEWVVALASRSQTSLGSSDPSGVLGQAARLQQVLTPLATAGPVVLVAVGAAGHAARVAADAVAGVTVLVTLGSPWSAVTFDSARTGVPADALRLLRALLPPVDPDDPDDPDLAAARALVGGFMDAARDRPPIGDLEAPRPTLAVREGLTAIGVFGVLSAATVSRAVTAVFAAGLSAKARARAAAASTLPTDTHLGVRVDLPSPTPPGGHGVTVTGSATLVLGSVTADDGPTVVAAPAVRLELAIADTDGWLVGGAGTTPAGGAPPLELRRMAVQVEIGLHGGASSAQLLLGEGSAFGADWAALPVSPPTQPTGELELQPLLPEAQALLTALTARLGTATSDSPAGTVLALLRAGGVTQDGGALVPDALDQLLHDPGGRLRTLVAQPTARAALLDALHGLLPPLTPSGDQVTLTVGPLTFTADLATGAIGCTVTATDGLASVSAGATYSPGGEPTLQVTVGDPAAGPVALQLQTGPLRVRLARGTAGSPVQLWPAFDADGLASFALAAIPAEALRIILEGLRGLDDDLGQALDALTSALGMLAAPDADGHRAVVAPVELFEAPARWFSRSVLTLVDSGPYDTNRLIDLLEAIKPFVGLTGTPRGSWPITDGVTLSVTAAAAGPNLALSVDATSWLAGLADRAPVAAGLTAGLTLPASGAPQPTVEVFLGTPDGPGGTSTPQHRSAAHLVVDTTGVRVLLRPSTGADIELFPHPAGLAALLGALAQQLLPMVLNQLAEMSGDATRTEVAALVSAAGRGLGVASSATPAVFDKTALGALAADPAGYLEAHVGTLLTQVGGALGPLLTQVLPSSHVTLDGAGTLTVTQGGFSVTAHPSPLSVAVTGTLNGLPVIDTVALSLGGGAQGISGWSATVGPAAIDLDGPVLRPFVRAGSQQPNGWFAELGLGLDAPESPDQHELFARWREADGALSVVAATSTGGAPATEDTTAGGVAQAAVEAVLELTGGWLLGVTDVKNLLAKPVGPSTVGGLLQGAVLTGTPAQLVPGVLDGWPGRLFTIAGNLAAAAPAVTVEGFTFALAKSSTGVLGVAVSTADGTGIDLTGGGEISLHLEVDASWIDDGSGTAATPGIVLDLVTVDDSGPTPTFTVTPGIAVDGVGIRLGKTSGPLIDAGLQLDTVAVHLFGSVQLSSSAQPAFAGGVQLELGGLAVPLGGGGGNNAVAQGIMNDAGGSGSPPRPKFSPAVAVQDHGSGVEVTLRAGSGPGPWYLPIQRAFGPVYLEQVGLGVAYLAGSNPQQLQTISLYLDGGVSLLGLSASVDNLRLGYHVGGAFFAGSSWEVDVDGFAISSNIAGLTLAGGLVKFDLVAPPVTGVEYLGMLKIGYAGYGVDLFGGYAHPTDASGAQFASFFAFGVLHAPIGGVPAFFITGIGIGLGINRGLTTPSIEGVNTDPFMVALKASGPTPQPMDQLMAMRDQLPPARGEYWVAAGISFTSFVLITGEILVTVQFGDGLDIAVLGLARAQLPTADLTLVSVELALLARFSSKDGLLLVQAQLTENSWLLEKSVRLTGGFAFGTWWKGPNAGQFVVTVGGYHPRFHHDGYPVVPRVGLDWSPIDNISVVGGAYFALCSEAVMAGLDIEVAAHFGPAHARLKFGGDAIVFFDPFWFSVDVYAEVNVGITIWLLFGSVDVELSFGLDVEVSGPPIFVTGHFSVCGVSIPFQFGDQGDPTDNALTGDQFAQKYLRGDKDAQVVQATVLSGGLVAGKASGGGQDKPPDGSIDHPFRVSPEFAMAFVSTAPAGTVTVTGLAGVSKNAGAAAPGLGVAPMYSATLDSSITVALARPDADPFDLGGVNLTARPPAPYPKGIWGEAQNPKAPTVPAGDTVNACDGLVLDTVLPGRTGSPPIDYHQVELPLAGRKPLPFVTNTADTDKRVTQSAALATAAQVLTAGSPDLDERFVRAARVLSAGGSGRSTVAALRGDRSAPPSFGSLADDLVKSPAAIQPPVTPVVVDRSLPPQQRFSPLVKAVLGVPLALAVDRPATTTVADTGSAVSAPVPTLASVRTANAGATLASLQLVPRAASAAPTTVLPTGAVPVTRLASGPVGAVANARPAPSVNARLTSMRAGLSTPDGALVHEGELAVITLANRPLGQQPDTMTVSGGATRLLCLAAGGVVVDDQIVGAAGDVATTSLPRQTERVVVVAQGNQPAVGGTIAGWYAGQSLPAVGWGLALAGGAVVAGQTTRVADNRERADGGYVSTAELAVAAQVSTYFTDPVDVIAIVVDDYLGSDAAGALSMRLLDATRTVDAAGVPLPPQVLVDGVRTLLLYGVTATGPTPGVLVTGCGGGHLGGVLGTTGAVTDLAAALVVTGVEAAVQQPLVGGPGQRRVSVVLGDGPVATPDKPSPATKALPTTKAATTKKAVPAKKAPTKKAPVKKAVPVKKASPAAKAAPSRPRKRT